MSPVKEADPAAKSLDEAFAAAMAGPAKPREVAAPPEMDRDAPHGREDDGTPKAPYGFNKDGSIRRSAAGRKPKNERARTMAPETAGEPAQPPGGGSAALLQPRDFSAALMDFGETAWFGGSVLAKIGPQVPVLGRFVPGRKLAATMAVFDSERPRLAAALNLAAQHDARARKLASKLADGDAGWALTCMFMAAPFAGAVAAVWMGDTALRERNLPGLDDLVSANEAAMDRMLAKISAQMELAQQQALEAEMAAAAGAGQAAGMNGQVPASA